MNHKAIALLSGGLDSTLEVRMMIDQGIDVTAELAIGRIIARYSQDGLPMYAIQRRIINGDSGIYFVTERFSVEQLECFLIGSKKKI